MKIIIIATILLLAINILYIRELVNENYTLLLDNIELKYLCNQ
jgi:hypothetical protein